MAAKPFLKLQADHKTVLVRDMDVFRALRDFLTNNGYRSVYETDRVGEAKTAMATFACHNPVLGERLAVVYGMSASDEVAHPQAPFVYGFGGRPAGDAKTYIQHLALRSTDIFKLRDYLEKKGAHFLTPTFQDKDSFGPLLQCFTRELFDDEWFFIEFVQRDYDPAKARGSGVQFVDKTVRSLYVAKQDEFREWLTTRKKRTFLDGLSKADAKAILHEILSNVEPKGYVETVPPLAKAVG
ncbi:MAG: hypothetical protein ACT4OI_08500 [Methanobacteriota archaeon]